MLHHKKTGDLGESIAGEFIIEKGYHILERNWRYKHWEVDIIASRTVNFISLKSKHETLSVLGNRRKVSPERKCPI